MFAKSRLFLITSALLTVQAFATQPSETSVEPASPADLSDTAPAEPAASQGFLERDRLLGDFGGKRTELEEKGVSIGFAFYGDIFKNLRGGANTEDLDFMHLESLTLTLDAEKLLGLKGGTFFVDLQHIGGEKPSENVGDWQWVSALASDRRDEVAELWYEQTLLDDQLRIKLGKIEPCYEFDVSDVGNYFSNSSSTQSPTIPGFPTYPDSAFGIVGEYLPTESTYIRVGLFDGALQEGKSIGDDGARTVFTQPADAILLAEVGTSWKLGHLPGRAAIGMSYHTGTFDRFDGGADDGVAGYWFVAEHMLQKESEEDDDTQGTSVFFRAGLTDGDTQEVFYHLGAGIVFQGFLDGREDDSVGLAANFVGFSNESNADFAGDELNFELFYQLQVTKYFKVTPDVQYVINPGGNASYDDALALGLRLQLEF